MNRMKYLNIGGLEEPEKEMYERKAEMSRMNDFMKGGLKRARCRILTEGGLR